MQKSRLDGKIKSKLLIGFSAVILLITIPLSLENFVLGNGTHLTIHILSIILGIFLSTVGYFTYKEFKNTRLFLVFCAFSTITVMEIMAFSTFIISFTPPNTSFDSLIVHGAILLTLLFFVAGIFRTD